MTVKVLVILGHPRPASFGAALFDAFCAGLDDAGVTYRALSVSELDFDPDVRVANPAGQSLEPELQQAQQDITWADHLVFIYPTWWGTVPARLKGLLDRILTPGFAFAYRSRGSGWDALLAGKTAELVTTMDTPGPVYRWIYGAPGYRAMARATLGFCGVKTVHITRFGPMHGSSDAQRRTWLQQIRERARHLAAGPHTPARRLGFKLWAWLRALRLQFYPMTWIAYAVGSLLAVSSGVNVSLFWIGYLALFALEAATVLSNEYFDFESDRNNNHPGPFNGGSRVLVDGSLSPGEMLAGFGVALGLFIAASGWLLAMPATGVDSFAVLAILTLLALGYTIPPLKLSYRGMGELDVAITHSIGVMLCGYVFQGGPWHHPLPWLLALPLGLAILPAIVLSGLPDREADRKAGKRTLAVRLGVNGAVALAMVAAVAASIAAIALMAYGLDQGAYGRAMYLVPLHAMILIGVLISRLKRDDRWENIPLPMVLSLSFVIWFGLVPLLQLS